MHAHLATPAERAAICAVVCLSAPAWSAPLPTGEGDSTVEVTLEVPRVVEAGTRFEVTWSGASGKGDFITVAHARSGPKKHLDWSYTDLGSPVTLAAPFDAGKYVVRYVSGTSDEIVARQPIEVR